MTCTTQRENVANDALGHILSSSKEARQALEELLLEGGAEVGSIERVSSQADLGQKIPDLQAFDAHGERRVLIEGKFWAELTKNQPVEYLKVLPPDSRTALLFVAPSSRSESLWPELRQRVKRKISANIKWGAETKTTDVKSAETGGRRRLMLTSWKALLGRMETRTNDNETKANIQQLRGLTGRMDAETFLPLQPSELGPEFARRLLGLSKLVDDVTQRGRGEGWLNTDGLAVAAWPDGYGRWVSLGGKVLRLAVRCDLWAVHQITPIWLPFPSSSADEMRRRLRPLRMEDPPGIVDDGDDLLVPIRLREGVEYDAVLDAVAARLKYVADLIGSDA